MTGASRTHRLSHQLRMMLGMAGSSPARWVIGVVAASLALALLDTLGVAAMVPLMELVTGGSPDAGWAGAIASILGVTSVESLIPTVAAFVAVVFIVKSVGALLFRWWLLGRTTRVSALAAAELMRRYALAPYADHRARRTSEIYRNINDSTIQAASVLLAATAIFSDVVMLAAIAIVLAITSLWGTLFMAALFVFLIFGVQRLLRRRQSRVGEEMATASLESWQFLLPGLDGFREARLTSSAGSFAQGFKLARLRMAHAQRQLGIIADVPRYLLEVGFVVAVGGIAAILFATTTAANTLTVLGVFAAASVRALPTLYRVAANVAVVRIGQVGLSIMSRATDELAARGQHDERPRAETPYAGDIVLRDVSFQYEDAERPVLESISLTVAENRTTAFVGSSGAGKSTLIDLVLGLLEPTKGTIECGGRAIVDDLPTWFVGLGVVPQDVFLLNSTLAANVAFGVPADRIDRDRVGKALGMAELDGIVADLPEGLDTMLGERGVRLSGGQRQRVGLARALYREPRVLVLDEATSALDNATEHEIAMTLATLQGSITIIVVAHRLSTVRNADTIVFLKDGRVEAKGRFDEVRTQSADFARLVELGELE